MRRGQTPDAMTCTAGADERAREGEARTDRGTAVGMPSQDRRSFHIIWRYRAVPDHEPRSRPGNRGFDPPEHIAAFLNTLRWNCTTATDPSLFQATLPAGIRIEACQSEPLRKALRLPRVHLPIADDTGPGKTIQAGLIVRELVPKPRVRTIVVTAPPSVPEEWKGEMEEHSGLLLQTLDHQYLVMIRRHCGFWTSAWSTSSPLLVSHRLPADRSAPAGEARTLWASSRL